MEEEMLKEAMNRSMADFSSMDMMEEKRRIDFGSTRGFLQAVDESGCQEELKRMEEEILKETMSRSMADFSSMDIEEKERIVHDSRYSSLEAIEEDEWQEENRIADMDTFAKLAEIEREKAERLEEIEREKERIEMESAIKLAEIYDEEKLARLALERSVHDFSFQDRGPRRPTPRRGVSRTSSDLYFGRSDFAGGGSHRLMISERGAQESLPGAYYVEGCDDELARQLPRRTVSAPYTSSFDGQTPRRTVSLPLSYNSSSGRQEAELSYSKEHGGRYHRG
jgi:hypothetical protein